MLTPEQIKNFKDSCLQGYPNWQIVGAIEDMPHVSDGVYDITGIEFILMNPVYKSNGINLMRRTPEEVIEHVDKLVEFLNKFPKCVLADAYQTEEPFFLASMPKKHVEYIGSGFNHGANNIIPNCPTSILIVAEDD